MKNILTSIDEIHTSINDINSTCYRFKEILLNITPGNTDLIETYYYVEVYMRKMLILAVFVSATSCLTIRWIEELQIMLQKFLARISKRKIYKFLGLVETYKKASKMFQFQI